MLATNREKWHRVPVRLWALTLLGVTGLGLSARAVEPSDFVASRAVAMGQNVLAASGPDALFLNPAGLGATNSYALQLDYLHANDADGIVISLADSLSNPMFPTGVSYRYFSAGKGGATLKGSIKDLAVAFALSPSIVIGTHIDYLSYTEDKRDISTFTGDLGLLLKFGPVGIGVVGTNLLKVDTPVLPQGIATGLSLGDGQHYLLAGDYQWAWPGGKQAGSWSLAGEYLLAGFLPLRFAVTRDGIPRDGVHVTTYLSGGVGFITKNIGLNASYRHDMTTGEGLWAFGLTVYAN